MPSEPATMELTPRVIDLGHRVILLEHVASFGVENRRPLLPLTAVLGAAAVLMAAYAVMHGARPLGVNAEGSVYLWGACIAAGLAVFSAIYSGPRLVIATADGQKFTLPTDRSASQAAIMDHLRRAVHAPPDTADHTLIDLASGGTVGTIDAVATPGEAMRHLAIAQTEAIIAEAVQSGHGANSGHRSNGVAHNAADGAYRDRVAEAFAAAEPAAGEIERLITFLEAREVPHKDALIGLLRVVDDHLMGGGTTRDEATAHWQSFVDYVTQYLSTIQGLSPLTKDVGARIRL